MLVSQLHFQNVELPIQDGEYAVGEKDNRIDQKQEMQNFKIQRAPWKDKKQHEKQKRKREEGPVHTPILSYASILISKGKR